MKEAAVRNMYSCDNMPLTDGRMSIRKEEISSCLVYNFFRLGKIAGKTKPFSGNLFQEDKLNMNLQSNI